MKQIGARQESGKVGGIGSCGRELCCSTWLSDFKSVNTTAARYQNLSINQAKLSGQCGRLKCCLNYELDTYMDALRVFPENADSIETIKGTATLQKRDIFKSLMWYSFSDSNKQYPLTIQRVKEIQQQNRNGIKPEELQPVELEALTAGRSDRPKVKVDVGFVNDVGQISLKSLEKGSNKKKSNKGGGQRADGRPNQQGGGNQQRNPSQQRPQGNRPNPQGGGNQQQRNPNQQQGGGQQQRPQGNRPNQQGGGNQQQRPQGNRPNNQQGGGQQRNPNQQRPQGNRPPQGDNKPPQQDKQG